MSVPDETYFRNAPCVPNLISTVLLLSLSCGELVVPEGIICPVSSVSAVTWLTRYTRY